MTETNTQEPALAPEQIAALLANVGSDTIQAMLKEQKAQEKADAAAAKARTDKGLVKKNLTDLAAWVLKNVPMRDARRGTSSYSSYGGIAVNVDGRALLVSISVKDVDASAALKERTAVEKAETEAREAAEAEAKAEMEKALAVLQARGLTVTPVEEPAQA